MFTAPNREPVVAFSSSTDPNRTRTAHRAGDSVLDNTPESEFAYALCYGCHSRNSILDDESFAEHRKHVESEETPCNACHEPHGVSVTQGNSMNNSHLINFDTSIVSPNSSALLQFVDNGDKAGSCDLLCHGKEHNNLEYQP